MNNYMIVSFRIMVTIYVTIGAAFVFHYTIVLNIAQAMPRLVRLHFGGLIKAPVTHKIIEATIKTNLNVNIIFITLLYTLLNYNSVHPALFHRPHPYHRTVLKRLTFPRNFLKNLCSLSHTGRPLDFLHL